MESAARRQIIGGGGARINKSRRRRPEIVGGAAGARLYRVHISWPGTSEDNYCVHAMCTVDNLRGVIY